MNRACSLGHSASIPDGGWWRRHVGRHIVSHEVVLATEPERITRRAKETSTTEDSAASHAMPKDLLGIACFGVNDEVLLEDVVRFVPFFRCDGGTLSIIGYIPLNEPVMRIVHGETPLFHAIEHVADYLKLIPSVSGILWPPQVMQMNSVPADLIRSNRSEPAVFVKLCTVK